MADAADALAMAEGVFKGRQREAEAKVFAGLQGTAAVVLRRLMHAADLLFYHLTHLVKTCCIVRIP